MGDPRFHPARGAGMSRPIVLAIGSLAVAAALVWLLAQPGRTLETAKQPLIVYCAAGVVRPVEAIARQYERATGTAVQIEPGGSGTLLSKIRVTPGRGHLFIAADSSYIERGRDAGLIADALPAARQRPVIGVAIDNPRGIRSLDDLFRDDVKLAVPNPELAALGRTVRQAMGPAWWARLEARQADAGAKVSMVGTVTEVAQAVSIGAVDAGLMWDSTAAQFGLGALLVEPLASVSETVTVGVLTGHDRAADALRLARYIVDPLTGGPHFAAHGFTTLEWPGPREK